MSRVLKFGTSGFDGAVPFDSSTLTPDDLDRGGRFRRRYMAEQSGQPLAPATNPTDGPFMQLGLAPMPAAAPATPKGWSDQTTSPFGERMNVLRMNGDIVDQMPASRMTPEMQAQWESRRMRNDIQQGLGLLDTIGMDPAQAAELSLRRGKMVEDILAAQLDRQQKASQFDRQLAAAAADRTAQMERLQTELGSRRDLADSENASRLKLAEINDPGRAAWAQAGAAVAMDPNQSPEQFTRRRQMLGGPAGVGTASAPSQPGSPTAPGASAKPAAYDPRGDEILAAIRQSFGKAAPSADGKATRYEIDQAKVTPEALAQLGTQLTPHLRGLTPEQRTTIAGELGRGGMDLSALLSRLAQEVARRNIVANPGGAGESMEQYLLQQNPNRDIFGHDGQKLMTLKKIDRSAGATAGRAAGDVGGAAPYYYDTIVLPDGSTVPFDRMTLPGTVSQLAGGGFSGQAAKDAPSNAAVAALYRLLAAQARPQ